MQIHIDENQFYIVNKDKSYSNKKALHTQLIFALL